MLGAIIGDIVGSVYEWHNIKTKDFPLFSERCFFTDDTVMTIAVADGLMNGGSSDNFIDSLKKFGRLYPNSGYGSGFRRWLFSNNREPYNSWGNGSAMRVSPCGWFAKSLDEAENLAETSAAVTHNHPEGIKGAQATAAAIYLARTDLTKDEIRDYIETKYRYDLHRTLDEIRPGYIFNESCQETVPEAIIAFLESTGFEDAIRNAISLGGDSDTLAAITGSIAEAAYGIPYDIREQALCYIAKDLRAIYAEWTAFISEFNSDDLKIIEKHFHNLIVERNEWNFHFLESIKLKDKKLPIILDMVCGKSKWYAVPGMYGGFNYELLATREGKPVLITESWCRVVGGSGQRHEITTSGGCVLVEEGFV